MRRPARAGTAALAALAAFAHAERWTRPAPAADFAAVRAAWAPSEARLLARDGRVLSVVRSDRTARRRDWVALRDVSPALVAAALRAEDRRFARHAGVDWRALAGAARPGRGGASTVTMQVAALLDAELGRAGARGPVQKAAQVRAALALERRWTKAQILEAWLNLLPWRGELVGIDAAARALAGKAPAALDGGEAAVLAALIARPSASPARVAARACRLLPAACGEAMPAALRLLGPRTAFPDPALAPHLAARLVRGHDVRTTLDADVQRLAADVLRERLAGLAARNVRDGAVIVADVRTGDVLAWVGGAGDASRSGAVDAAAAPRQAGSTLKPFLYALAIERRLLTAASVLDDSPVDLDTASGLYVPQNYDRSFRGPVSVRSALGNSLNVPAVRALRLVGVEAFRDRLFDGGYRGIVEDGDHYGFSLALGSAEVTLAEQVAAYRALARGGLYAPLRLEPGAAAADRRVADAGAAAIVADILADPAARAATFGAGSALDLPQASVKTGTSKALRDNWCIGFTDRFVVGVWVGNHEGDAMGAGVSGVSGAAPAWAAIVRALHARLPPAAARAPGGVERARVRFEPAIEPPRDELFAPGTAMAVVRMAAGGGRPRIVDPVSGGVYALDPDIPGARQRLLVRTADAPAGAWVAVDGRRADGGWPPVPGRHVMALRGRDGAVLDRAVVVVR